MQFTADFSTVGLRVAEKVTMTPAQGPPREIKVDFFAKPDPPPPTHQPKFTQTNLEGRKPPVKAPAQPGQDYQAKSESASQGQQQNSQMVPVNRPGTTTNFT